MILKCAIVECFRPRVVYTAGPVASAFCAEHALDYAASPESKQPKRGEADFVERRWKETCHADSVIRGKASEAEYEARLKAVVAVSPDVEAREKDRLARLARWKTERIAKPISPEEAKQLEEAARGKT